MADDPTNVEIGMEAWMKAIDQIDAVAENGFGDFEAAGHRSIGAYYVSLYTTLKNTMGEISNEFYKGDKANEKALFKRAVGILDKFHKYAQESREALLETKNFHYKLWIRLDDFGHQPWTSYDIDIQKHIQRMIALTVGLQPPFEQAWKDGDLINHKRFQVAYESFLQLDDKNAYDDVERRNFVLRSQQLVQQALIGLRLLTVSTDLQVNWTNNEIRPTYVDFPYGSEEYFYGLGARPGVLNIKLKLGGKITPEERKKMKKATKKRSAPAPAPEQRQGKRPRPNWGYTMTMENVDADIEDIYHDAAFMNVTKRPSADVLVTPLTANRATTLANYRDDLTKIIRRHRSAYYKPETPPTSQVDRDRLIERIEKEIPGLRDMAKEVRTSSTAKLKRAKLAAFSLRFLRALHMKLVLSSTPPVSNEQMNRALIGRMEDWSTFERTWNESDAKTRLIPRLTLELQREIDDAFRARSANILDWTLLLNQLRSGLGPDVPEEPEPPQEPQEPEESPDQNQPKEQAKVSYKLDPNDTTMWFIEPRRPGRSVYVSEKIDRRQEERARARAIDSALMQTGKKEGKLHRLEEKYSAEDKLSDAIAAALAKKGPPDYAKIPVETVLEKITYMIVIHHWRLFQTARIL